MERKLQTLLEEVKSGRGPLLVLTGAGISAESGIPTFRGEEGLWVVGSKNYMPQEMATRAMFERSPEEVWRWYLYRFGVCRNAQPNVAHRALVALEKAHPERFTLVTQNIDGLHRRAGSQNVYCIHGDAEFVRCANECGGGLSKLPDLGVRTKNDDLSAVERSKLTCPRCGSWFRPHVLWFDEYYDETYYRMESALRAAQDAALLLVVGTSGATNLPMQIGHIAFSNGAALVDVNPDPNPFAELASLSSRGFFAKGTGGERLPEIVRALGAQLD